MQKSKSGFTIVELVVVIVVIAILATITVIAYRGVQERARDDRRRSDLSTITKALELYYDDNGAYPIASGSSSSINPSWYSSNDASWTTFSNLLSPSVVKSVPVDPRNNGHPLTSAANYGYAYFSGSYCGAIAGQWYLLVYKFEGSPKEQFTDGNCSTNPLGESYYNSYGDSFYRVIK